MRLTNTFGLAFAVLMMGSVVAGDHVVEGAQEASEVEAIPGPVSGYTVTTESKTARSTDHSQGEGYRDRYSRRPERNDGSVEHGIVRVIGSDPYSGQAHVMRALMTEVVAIEAQNVPLLDVVATLFPSDWRIIAQPGEDYFSEDLVTMFGENTRSEYFSVLHRQYGITIVPYPQMRGVLVTKQESK